LPQEFIKHEVENEGDWSEWVNPYSEQYFMKCCDCGLVHEMQFNVAKYSEGDECEFVEDADLQAVFRARRATPPTPVQEPVALPCCGYTDASAIKWNPFNGVVQCHNCGQTYATSAAQAQEPVALRAALDEAKECFEAIGADGGKAATHAVNTISYIRSALYTTPPAQPAPVQEPVAVCHDDGYWTPLKTEAGRRFNNSLSKAGSRINVYTQPAAPVQEPSFKEWTDDYVRDNIHKLKERNHD
jgi:transcription elongation factor Elf1